MSERITRCREVMDDHRICVVIPTYNNASTLLDVLARVYMYSPDLIVVNDGSTDNTESILQDFCDGTGHAVTVVSHTSNKGKGAALLTGFSTAKSLGFSYVVTIDSDGQHFPEDLPSIVAYHSKYPRAIIVGQRDINARNMPGSNSFANKFSNFWFWVETGKRLADTQTGYRLYPLDAIFWERFITSRYEAELELMVYASWHGVQLVQTPIRVLYAPAGQRVSHFRPGLDFTRISILNSVLCFFTVTYAWPVRLFRKIFRK